MSFLPRIILGVFLLTMAASGRAASFLTELATATGGRISFPVSASDRANVVKEIVAMRQATKGP